MAKKAKNGCVAKCEQVGGKRECNIMKPIYGTDRCEPRTTDEFDESSFFSKKSGNATIVIGCPKGFYDSAKRKCRKGTRAFKMILPT